MRRKQNPFRRRAPTVKALLAQDESASDWDRYREENPFFDIIDVT